MNEQEHAAYWRGYNDAKEAIQSGQLRVWVGLTPQERDEINEKVYGAVPHHVAFHVAIEQALREKNT